MTDPQLPPDGLLAYVLNELVEIKAHQALQDARLEAQERLILAVALALPEAQRVHYLELVVALQLNALATGERNAAKLMTAQVDRWKAMCGPTLEASHAEQLLALHGMTRLLAEVPPHLKAAQQAWFSIASPEEIAQELADLLAQRPLSDAGPKPSKKRAGGDGGAKRKKKSSGD